jgi:hypothetical protein
VSKASLVEFLLFKGTTLLHTLHHVQMAAGTGIYDQFGFTFLDAGAESGTAIYSIKSRLVEPSPAYIAQRFIGVS